MEPLGVHHVAVKAKDPERTAAFYREVLRLSETDRHEDDRGLRSVWLKASDTVLMIERSDTAQPGPAPAFDEDPPGLHLLALRIRPEDRSAWIRELEARGHPVVQQTDYTLYVSDPEGNRVGLSTWPERLRL